MHEKKRELHNCKPNSQERFTYFAFSEIQISPKEEMEINSLFLITGVLRPKNMYQLEHCTIKRGKKHKICYASSPN